MHFYPNIYIEKITDITMVLVKKYHIKGFILDVDNTLIDYNKQMLEGVEKWCNDLKKETISFCIVSNSNKKEKVKKVAKKLDIPYVFFATKPFKRGFKKAKRILGLQDKQIAVVGDQLFTDVLGANRCNMISILTKPIDEKDLFITVIKRPIERYILKKYESKQKGEK